MTKSIPFGPRSRTDDVLAGLDLWGRTIVITGCNSDIGFETFPCARSSWWDVIGLARTLEAARDACQGAGGSSTPVACDLADLDSVIAATNAVHTLGRLLDTLVASAGIMG